MKTWKDTIISDEQLRTDKRFQNKCLVSPPKILVDALLQAQAEITWKARDVEVIEARKAGRREAVEELKPSLDFAFKVARVMDSLKSSHIFFVLQQAWMDTEMDWEEAQSILDAVLLQAETYTSILKKED
jgi:hypothetical protein